MTQTKSRASRAAGKAAQDQGQQPEPQPEPEAQAEPQGQVDLGRYPYWMHKPKVTGPDGITHECPHRDGHTKESDAWTCARRVARENGLEVGEPE